MKILKRYRLWACICFIFFAVAALCAPAKAQEDPAPLRVPFVELEGLMEKDSDGRRYGLVVDYLNEIAKYTGWEYEYIDTNGEEMLDGFIEGKYDLMGGTYYLPVLEQYCAFPDYNIGFSRSVLMTRKDDNSIRGADMQTLNGKIIGVYDRAEENIRRLQEFLAINDLDCVLKYYSYEDLTPEGNLYPYLESGEVDLLLGNSVETNSSFRVVFSYDSQAYYIVASVKDQEVLDGLNMALEKIYDSSPNFATERYAANFQDFLTSDIHLNKEELTYIQENGTVVVAVPKSYHPLSCMDADALHSGLVQDILNEVAAFTGLKVSYEYVDSYMEAMELVQQGEADMMGFYLGSQEESLEDHLVLTAPYASLNRIVIRNKTVSFPQNGLVGAVTEGVSLPADIKASGVQVYSSADEALAAVNRGDADFVFGMAAYLEVMLYRGHYANVVPTTIVNDRKDVYFALARPADPQLLAILNKGINNISGTLKSKLLDQNMVASGTGQLTVRELIYTNPVMFIGILSAFFILLVATVFFIFRSKMKAAAMKSDLEKAEAESRAKGAFLSHMSHELRTPMNAVVGLANLTGMTPGLPEAARDNLQKLQASSYYLLDLINDILDSSRLDSGALTISEKPFSLGKMFSKIQDMMQNDANRRGIDYKLETQIEHDSVNGDITRLQQVLTNLLSNAFKFTPEGGKVTLQVVEKACDEKSAFYTFRVIDNGIGIAPQNQSRIFETFEQVENNYSTSQGTGLGLPISRTIVEKMGGTLSVKSEPGKGSEFYFEIMLPFIGRPKCSAEDQEMPTSHALPHSLDGVRILLVEDNDLNAEIATELLETKGAVIIRSENGKLAVEQFIHSKPSDFQVILMDIQMPQMNGLDATRAIRALERPDAKEIPIVAMTANTFQSDVDAAMEAGMNEFISKPMDVERLYHLVSSLLIN